MKVDDVSTILRALNDADVRYLIVGGLAVVAHGYGYRPLVPVKATQFADETLRQQWRDEKGMIVFQLFNPHRESTRVDIFIREPFLFAEEFETAKWHTWGELRAPVLRIEALIVMKEAAGRPQDVADAALLRDILQVQRDQSAP